MKVIIERITEEDYIIEKGGKIFHLYGGENCWKIRYYLNDEDITRMDIVPDFKTGLDRIFELMSDL